jgi:hypothetical protein
MMSQILSQLNCSFSLSLAKKQIEKDTERVSRIEDEISHFQAALQHLETEKNLAILQVGLDKIVKQVVENLTEDEAFCAPMEYSDYRVHPRERKTRVDVLTPYEAVKSCKTSKNHKLKPKTANRDKTKTAKSKTFSLNKKYSSNKKEAAGSF